MANNRDNFLKNKVRFRHKHESKEEMVQNTNIEMFRFNVEDLAEWLKEIDVENLNVRQLIVLDELRWEISALFSDAVKLVEEYEN